MEGLGLIPLEIPDTTNFHPWKFHKRKIVVLPPLEISRPKTKIPGTLIF